MADALMSDGLEPTPGRPRKSRIDARVPELSLFDFPLRKAAEAQREAEFVAPVLATPTREILGMVRAADSIESQRAAVDALAHRTQIQQRILSILKAEGPQADPQLAQREEFRNLGQSTVRTRRSELVDQGLVVKVGRLGKHSLWGVAK